MARRSFERAKLFERQTKLLDGRASQQYNSSVRLQPKPVVVPGTAGAIKSYNGKYRGPLLAVARAAARKHRVPEDLFLNIFTKTSIRRSVKLNPQISFLTGKTNL